MKIITNQNPRVKHIFATIKISSGINTPKEGIFWVIDDTLVAFCNNVDINGSLDSDDLLHKDVWNEIKNKFKVNGKVVSYDYYPRGRVMITSARDKSGKFQYYSCTVYGDRCIINDPDIQDEVESEFRLYLKQCKVSFEGQMSIDGTHYTCHNCHDKR